MELVERLFSIKEDGLSELVAGFIEETAYEKIPLMKSLPMANYFLEKDYTRKQKHCSTTLWLLMLIISIWSKLEKRYLKETNKMQGRLFQTSPAEKSTSVRLRRYRRFPSIKVLKSCRRVL